MYSFVDYRITDEEFLNLKKQNVIPIKIPKTNLVYQAINGHVDIQLNILDKESKLIIVHKDIEDNFIKKLKKLSFNVILSNSSLKDNYPKDIVLNSLITKDFLLHNLKYTDKEILKNKEGRKLLNVSQGYTKCSTLVVSEKAFITSDKKISDTLKKEGYDVLLVPPGDIILEGLNYGFIGGTGGLISDDKLAFFGSLDFYKYGDKVKAFLKDHKVTPIYLSNSKLIDRGSILTL